MLTEAQAAEIIGPYLHLTQYVTVFRTDEKTAIQGRPPIAWIRSYHSRRAAPNATISESTRTSNAVPVVMNSLRQAACGHPDLVGNCGLHGKGIGSLNNAQLVAKARCQRRCESRRDVVSVLVHHHPA